MRIPAHDRSRQGDGFTLVELLVVVVILGIISFALTESIIVGLRTTEGTGARVSNSSASQSMASSLTADGQSADEVFIGDDGLCAQTGTVFLHLRWTDKSVTIPPVTTFAEETTVVTVEKKVSYALDPSTGPEQDVVRWTCGSGAPAPRIVGHLSHDESITSPVRVQCAPVACPMSPSSGSALGVPSTIVVSPDARLAADDLTDDVTIRRRSA